MTRRAVVIRVALLASPLFSDPDPRSGFLPVLALVVGPVMILCPVTEENTDLFLWSLDAFVSANGEL